MSYSTFTAPPHISVPSSSMSSQPLYSALPPSEAAAPFHDDDENMSDDFKPTSHELELELDRALPHYRVYKRRFLGLGVLMLLNIIVSWCWLTYAPVSRFTAEYFSLPSETPVNWLSTVILCAYCVSTP